MALEVTGRVALRQRLPLEPHLSRRLVEQAEQGLAERRLAGAALADQPDDLARGDIKADIVDRVHRLVAAYREVLGQALGFYQRCHASLPSSGAAAA